MRTCETHSTQHRPNDWRLPVAWGLLLVPELFFSSPEVILCGRLIAGIISLTLFSQSFSNGLDLRIKTVISMIFIVISASWLGALTHQQPLFKESLLAVGSVISILGFMTFLSMMLRSEKWRGIIVRTLTYLLAFLLISSWVGYFLPLQRLIPLGAYPYFFEPTRLSLIWPTRLLMGWAGQIGWGHTNHAGMVFSIGLVFVLNQIGKAGCMKKWQGFLFAILLSAAIFLTGSRTSLLMLVVALPWVWWGRSIRYFLQCLGILTVGVILGIGSLQLKETLMRPPAPPVSTTSPGIPNSPAQAPPATPHESLSENDLHLKGLVSRGSSGRMHAYQTFWVQSSGARLCGRGLTENLKPLVHLNHEHSSYLATFRGGGFIALTAHLVILLVSGITAFQLYVRSQIRWPLILLAAVLPALLFDRGSVFIPLGGHEFLFHWTAVLCPLLIRFHHLPFSRDPAACSAPLS